MENGKEIPLEMLDIAGQERFQSYAFKVCSKAQGILVCFDLTYRKTFNHIKKWLDEINENYKDIYKNIPIVLLGNKWDKIDKMVITEEEAIEFQKSDHYLIMKQVQKQKLI